MPPPRKPLEQHLAEGTFRRDRHRGPDEMRPRGEPEPSDSLSDAARSHWSLVVPDLIARGVVAKCDEPALNLLCETLALCWEAATHLQANPRDKDARIAYSNHLDRFMKLSADFGLSPRARTAVPTRLPESDAKREEFLRLDAKFG